MNKYILTEFIASFALTIAIISFIPQVYKIYITNNTRDLEIITFYLLLLTQILWLLYGIINKSISFILFSLIQIILLIYIITIIFINNKKNKYHYHYHIH